VNRARTELVRLGKEECVAAVWARDVRADASWIASDVGAVVPPVFDAYARVFHPLFGRLGNHGVHWLSAGGSGPAYAFSPERRGRMPWYGYRGAVYEVLDSRGSCLMRVRATQATSTVRITR
jgi:hypothetical protein